MDKRSLRRRLIQARRELSSNEREFRALNESIAARVDAYLGDASLGDVAFPNVAAYAPLDSEPGGAVLLPTILRRARSVLVPITQDQGQLRWAPYSPDVDSMEVGPMGVLEPSGDSRPTADALSGVDVLIVPALAVDPQTGVRLGKGGGFYDRALATIAEHSGVRPRLCALVFDNEVIPGLPAEEHDMPVDAYVTPTRTVTF